MMIRAELWDLWPQGSNPCRNMRRYRTKPRERFLSLDELKRLGFVLDHMEDRQAAVVVRLLLFTGARSSEIAGLRWDWIRDTRAVLPDSMSGPTTRALRPDPTVLNIDMALDNGVAVDPEIPATTVGSLLPAMKRPLLLGLQRVTRRAVAKRRSRWKPSSLKTHDIYMRDRLMPAFGRLRLDAIDHARVSAWFDAASADRPGAANRAIEILRAMLATARQWGKLGEHVPDARANIVKNPRRPVARFLGRDELNALARCWTGTPPIVRGRSRRSAC